MSLNKVFLETIFSNFRLISKLHEWEVICCAKTSGPSMTPTIKDGDYIIADKHWSVFTKNFNRGDIVRYPLPIQPNFFMVKRITAIAGDTVTQGCQLKVVPKGHVWLLGDNPRNSCDSRRLGPFPVDCLAGRIIAKISPIDGVIVFTNDTKEIQ